MLTVPTVALGFYLIYGRELSTGIYLLLFVWIIVVMLLYWYLPAVNVLYPDFKLGKKLLFSLVAAGDRWILTVIFLPYTDSPGSACSHSQKSGKSVSSASVQKHLIP